MSDSGSGDAAGDVADDSAAQAWAALRGEIEADVRRVAERLRALSEARLAGEVPGHRSRAAAGLNLAQVLADLAAGVEGRAAVVEPVWRVLPVVSDFAVGDQVAVTGHDVKAALADLRPEDTVWTRSGTAAARTAATALAAEIAATRRLF